MNTDIITEDIRSGIEAIRMAKRLLRQARVIHHEKTFHCELAEWLIATYLGGKRAILGNQKGWDLELADGSKIQVKSHAKARTNGSNWTTLSPRCSEVSKIFIVVFTADYFIQQVFEVDEEDAYAMCNSKRELTWRRLEKAGKNLDMRNIKKQFPIFFRDVHDNV